MFLSLRTLLRNVLHLEIYNCLAKPEKKSKTLMFSKHRLMFSETNTSISKLYSSILNEHSSLFFDNCWYIE